MSEFEAPLGASPHEPSPDGPAPHVKLVKGGSRPLTRGQRSLFGCCGFVFVLILGTCVWSGYTGWKAYKRPIYPGEVFYPEGAAAPDNLVVVRADLASPGFNEQCPVLLREATRHGDDAKLPDSFKWLRDVNGKNTAAGLGLYLPLTVTTIWDEPSPAPSPPPVPSLLVENAGSKDEVVLHDTAAIASALALTPPPDSRHLVVLQYRGFASLIAKLAAPFVEKAGKHELIEHDGMRLSCGPASATDPDHREVVAVGDRLLISNRLSLAKSSLDAFAAPAPVERAADDPRRLLDLLPADRDALGLHRGRAAAAVVDLFLEHHRSLVATKHGGNLDNLPPLPETPFDKTALDALAWSMALGEGDRSRVDVVLRFKTEAAAVAAQTALTDPKGAHWTWLDDLHVPTEMRSVERPGPLVVHLSAAGPEVSAAIKASFEDHRALDKTRRTLSFKLVQERAAAIGSGTPVKPPVNPRPR